MDSALVWLFCSFAVERLVEQLMRVWPSLHKRQLAGIDVPTIISFALALFLAYGARIDFFAIFQIEFAWPSFGPLLSAVFMAGGSNAVHDMLEWVKASKEGAKRLNQQSGQ